MELAAQAAGIKHIEFYIEPIAAALEYEKSISKEATGLDKPETAEQRRNVPLSVGADRVRGRFEAMSTEELLEIVAGQGSATG